MCSKHQTKQEAGTAKSGAAAVKFRVDDMTCSHCAGTITSAIVGELPNAHVSADPASKLVSITGSTDAAHLKHLIESAGYTPVAV